MNDNEKSHDLYDFMYQISNDIASKYKRIQKRATDKIQERQVIRAMKTGQRY